MTMGVAFAWRPNWEFDSTLRTYLSFAQKILLNIYSSQVYHPIVHMYLNRQDFTYMFCGLWAISIICVLDIVEIVYFIFQIDCDTLQPYNNKFDKKEQEKPEKN